MKWSLPVLLVVLMVGCSRREPAPKTVGEAKTFATKARDEAQAARGAKSPKEAAKAAERARKMSDLARTFILRPGTTAADNVTAAETFAAARDAGRFADLAEEDKRLAGEVSSLKARAYRTARGVAIKAVFTSLGLAARQAQSGGASSLSGPMKDAALTAAAVAGECSGRADLPDGTPDWAGIASDMNALSSNPPAKLNVVLFIGSLLLSQNRLALYEMETVDPQLLVTPEEKSLFHLLRGVALSMNGFPKLGVEQGELAAAVGGQDPKSFGPEWLSLVHLVLASEYLCQNEGRKADLEVVRAMQVWPDNPLAVFLTGEKLAADGQYEQAAESLEKAATGTQYEWLAKKLSARAREVRDRKGDAKPLFTDIGFLCDVMVYCVAETAEEKAPRQLKGVVAAARSLGKRFLDALPTKE